MRGEARWSFWRWLSSRPFVEWASLPCQAGRIGAFACGLAAVAADTPPELSGA